MTAATRPLTDEELEARLFENYITWLCHCVTFGIPRDQWANVWYGAPTSFVTSEQISLRQVH